MNTFWVDYVPFKDRGEFNNKPAIIVIGRDDEITGEIFMLSEEAFTDLEKQVKEVRKLLKKEKNV